LANSLGGGTIDFTRLGNAGTDVVAFGGIATGAQQENDARRVVLIGVATESGGAARLNCAVLEAF
jgi:hypothetical protein